MPNYSAIWPIGTPPDIILHRSNCCLFCLLFVCVTVGTLLSTQYCQYWLCLKISTLSFHWKALSPGLSLSVVKNLLAKSPSDWCKISSDGVPIGSGTLAGDLGGITIWNPWSNESDANLAVNDRKSVFHFRPKPNIWPEKHLALGRIPKPKPNVLSN